MPTVRALVTKCSGLDRVPWPQLPQEPVREDGGHDGLQKTRPDCPRCAKTYNGRQNCCDIGGAWEGACSTSPTVGWSHTFAEGADACEQQERREAEQKRTHLAQQARRCPSKKAPREHGCWLTKGDWWRKPQWGWAEAVMDRSARCLVSICSMINTTTQGTSSATYELGALVDLSTPSDVIAAYERHGVVIHNLSRIRWPAYFNNVLGAPPSKALRLQAESASVANATVAEALRLGSVHYSSVPDSFLKLWLFNMTRFESILYFDPDTLAVRNTSGYFRYAQSRDITVWQPRRRRNIQAGIMVIKPSRKAFEGLTRLWYEGDYRYQAFGAPGQEYGDDDQLFLADAFFSQRLLPGHRFNVGQMHVCDNNKNGRYGNCSLDRMSLLHKAPAWEERRIKLLVAAARAGRCANNPELAWDAVE